jgi:acyl carrier protein
MKFERAEVEKTLYESVAKVTKKDLSELKPETRWEEDLGFKSVHGMKLCALLNYYFKITLPLSKLIECATLNDAVDMLVEFVNA